MRDRIPAALRRLALLALLGAATTAPSPASAQPTAGSGGVNAPAQQGKPYVVLVSFDGFRADYLDSLRPPNVMRVAERGARAAGLVPIFPSKTFPNHYAIVTGLTAEHHGIVANGFYDPRRDEVYALARREAVQDGSWYRGEPLWVTAEKQGMVAASYFWPGSEAAIGGVRPTIFKVYHDSVPNADRVDSVLAWLELPAERRPHLLTMYFSDVDHAGHNHGPFTPELREAVARVDGALGRLLDGVERLPIRDSVFVLLVSDHGMLGYTPDQVELVDRLIDTTGVRIADIGPNANLHVQGGAARAREVRDALNRGLRHGRAYLRAEVPARFHYRDDPRIGDVVIVMEAPWQVTVSSRAFRRPGGAHGWDPELPGMRGIFVAMGPGVRRGAALPLVRNLDIYPFVTELLALCPARPVDGRAGRLAAQVLTVGAERPVRACSSLRLRAPSKSSASTSAGSRSWRAASDSGRSR